MDKCEKLKENIKEKLLADKNRYIKCAICHNEIFKIDITDDNFEYLENGKSKIYVHRKCMTGIF